MRHSERQLLRHAAHELRIDDGYMGARASFDAAQVPRLLEADDRRFYRVFMATLGGLVLGVAALGGTIASHEVPQPVSIEYRLP